MVQFYKTYRPYEDVYSVKIFAICIFFLIYTCRLVHISKRKDNFECLI
jgi:hypothetical protein